MTKLAIIGAGMMGEALARGLLSTTDWTGSDLVLCDVRSERLDELGTALGSEVTDSAPDAASKASGVLLAVKPQDSVGVLGAIAGKVGPSGLVSIVAGVRTAVLEEGIGGGSVVRAMPNTPARISKGVTALCAGSATSRDSKELAEEIFSGVGPVLWLDEDKLDAVTAVSGSGPAYVFYLAEAMVAAATDLGLDLEIAKTLAFRTIEGAGAMLNTTGLDPAELRRQVTSPGGTTAAAISVFESERFTDLVKNALSAARDRSVELGS